ncbi:MAG: GrpB family protein [Planctomycetaceae bacterium]
MPPPRPVELLPHSPRWALEAEAESARLLAALGPNLVAVHHIGSTAISGILAKPILDLLPECRSLVQIEEGLSLLQNLGYQGWGELGIAGRRYFTLDDLASGKRRVQLHCFEVGHSEIERHLAFRDLLRADHLKAQEYAREKQRCRDLHPDSTHAYTDAKAGWIESQLPEALARFRRRSPN